jgi:hypothetical protein
MARRRGERRLCPGFDIQISYAPLRNFIGTYGFAGRITCVPQALFASKMVICGTALKTKCSQAFKIEGEFR